MENINFYKQLKEEYKLTTGEFAKKFRIPYGTVISWNRTPMKQYLVSMMRNECRAEALYGPIEGLLTDDDKKCLDWIKVASKDEYKDILLHLRQRDGFTRKKLSEYYHIPIRTLEDWEHGNRYPMDYVLRLLVINMAINRRNSKV